MAGDNNYEPATSSSASVNAIKALQSALSVTGAPSSAIYGQSFVTGTAGGTTAAAVTFAASGSCSMASKIHITLVRFFALPMRPASTA
jgi:hypothetical protein